VKVTERFSSERSSVPAARRFATSALAQLPDETLQAVELMVSELTTNSIRHVNSAFELTIETTSREIKVIVTDRGGGTPQMRIAGPEDVSGRGLRIVDLLSDRWGVDKQGERTRVWFTVAMPKQARRAIACLASFALALSIGACGGGGGGGGGGATTGSTGTNGTSATATSTTGASVTATSTGPATTAVGAAIPATVAVAAGSPISRGVFLHWLTIAAESQSAQGQGTPALVPTDPPAFSKCIADARRGDPKLAKAPASQVQADCSQLFKSLSSQALDYLIKADWYLADAARRGVRPSNAAVLAAFQADRNRSFPTTAGFLAFLRKTGQTRVDAIYRVRVTLVANQLAAKEPGGPAQRVAALQQEVRRRYRAGTHCAAIVAMPDCGSSG
jgi:anti-sigma regulatory factor (Ser/Thr protein kinase)